MPLKKTLTEKMAPMVAAATVMLTPTMDAREQQSDFPKEPVSINFVQRLKNTSQNPKNKVKRFEIAAALAKEQNKDFFVLDNQAYDTNYVQEFIECGKSVDQNALNGEFMHDVLVETAKVGQTGKCFGKNFSNAGDCFYVMNKIKTLRLLHSTAWNLEKGMFQTKKFREVVSQVKNLQNEFDYKDQKYDLRLDISPEKQWGYFKNVNEEFTPNLDLQTKYHLRSYAMQKGDISPQLLSRLYKLMDVSGNPSIRPMGKDKTPVGWVANGSPHFTPDLLGSGGTIYSASSFLIGEIAHAFRNKNNTFGEGVQFIRDGLKDILAFNNAGFTEKSQLKNYEDKDKMEYDCHKIVEPAFKAYLNGKIKTIEQMYAKIDKDRQNHGISYSQTNQAEEMTKIGYEQLNEQEVKKTLLAGLVGKNTK